MSSTKLTDIESKINEVRDRLTNLSKNFQHAKSYTELEEVVAAQPADQQLEERDPFVLTERSVNAGSAAKGLSGGLNRLIELAKKEVVQRQGGDTTPQLSSRRESRCTSPVRLEKSHDDLQTHTYYDPTPTVPPYQGFGATSVVSIQKTARPQRSVPFYSVSTSEKLDAPYAGRFSSIDASPTLMTRVNTDVVNNFDPFKAVQSRLREKLRKSTFCSSLPSSPEKSTKAPSPVASKMQYRCPSEEKLCTLEEVVNAPQSNSTQGVSRDAVQEQRLEQEEVLELERPTETRSPSVKAAADAIRCVRERFSSTGTPRRPSSLRSSGTTEKPKQRNTQQQQQRQQQQQKKKWWHQQKQEITSHLTRTNSRTRCFSSSGRQSVANCSSFAGEKQPSRRQGSVGSRRSSPCRATQPALPLRTTPQRTVLDVLTGAEVFALMRLRGVIVSRGDTGECMLPDTRCHSIYLSQNEHRQLVELRTSLRKQSVSVNASNTSCHVEGGRPVASKKANGATNSRQLPRSSSGALRR